MVLFAGSWSISANWRGVSSHGIWWRVASRSSSSATTARSPGQLNADIDQSVAEKMTRMFGTDIWLDAAEARRKHLLTGVQYRAELTKLMRWRLQEDLGYWATLTFQVTNTGGSDVFDMIFATDHRAGLKIMTGLYNAARRRQSVLSKQAQLQPPRQGTRGRWHPGPCSNSPSLARRQRTLRSADPGRGASYALPTAPLADRP